MKADIDVTIRNKDGGYGPVNLFQFFDDGIRKRLPQKVAANLKAEIIKNIDGNVFNFHLSQYWINKKRRLGADSRPFIMFRYYKDAITIVTDSGHLSVGFKKTMMHPRAKVAMGKLAIQLEYGDLAQNIPARPLWRKSIDKYFRSNKAQVTELIRNTIKNGK